MSKRNDFELSDHGSIVLLFPRSAFARVWTQEHLPEDAPRFGHAYAIEHRFADDIIQGILEDGGTIGGQS